MHRLIKSGLMFGNLVHVDSPALVERYNRALNHLTGRTTELTDFYIDISGYSPEIGHELGDPEYLNHKGVNRQFILLTIDQKTAPLLEAKFSTSRGILRQFIEENEPALFALTARDAVAGELVNSVFDLSDPKRLFDIRKIKVEADTTNGSIRRAEELDDKVNRFLNEEDAWFDDVLIAEMIGLAGETGDIVRNPVTLTQMEFEQRNYWTAHFGGLYLFQDLELPGLISSGPRDALGDVPMEYVFDLSERNRIANFLDLNGLVEPIVKARGIDAAAILRQKMDFVLVDALSDAGVDLPDAPAPTSDAWRDVTMPTCPKSFMPWPPWSTGPKTTGPGPPSPATIRLFSIPCARQATRMPIWSTCCLRNLPLRISASCSSATKSCSIPAMSGGPRPRRNLSCITC